MKILRLVKRKIVQAIGPSRTEKKYGRMLKANKQPEIASETARLNKYSLIRTGAIENLSNPIMRQNSELLFVQCLLRKSERTFFPEQAYDILERYSDEELASLGPTYFACPFAIKNPKRLKKVMGLYIAQNASYSLGDLYELLKASSFLGDQKAFDKFKSFYVSKLARKSPNNTDHSRIRTLINQQERQSDRRSELRDTNQPIVALLSYFATGEPQSKNIGDQVQSIAMLGQLMEAGLNISSQNSASRQVIERLRESNPTRYGSATGPQQQLVYLDRDALSEAVSNKKIWVPIFGWHSHAKLFGQFERAPANNIRPLFFSFHVARPQLLSKEYVSYLKKYEPIGCRDYNTARLLKARGVSAFFSGCVTTTMGKVFPPIPVSDRNGRFTGAYTEDTIEQKTGYEFCPHTLPELINIDYEDSLNIAIDLLAKYRSSTHIRTNLLHCFVPSRAMGADVDFLHENLNDARFEGLVDVDDHQLAYISRMHEKFVSVLKLILAGEVNEERVYSEWSTMWAGEISATDEVLSHSEIEWGFNETELDEICAEINICDNESAATSDDLIEICMSFDENIAEHVNNTVTSILSTTNHNVRFHFLTRNVSNKFVHRLFAHNEHRIDFVQYEMDNVDYGELKLLKHTTVSTMDRLLIPRLLRDLDKVIYLDIDVHVYSDISALWNIELGNNAVAARESISPGWKEGALIALKKIRSRNCDTVNKIRNWLYKSGAYNFYAFNAGVLCLNIKRLNELNAVAKSFYFAKETGLNDQYIMNLICAQNYLKLDKRWNHYNTQELQWDPFITHFVGPIKQWHRPKMVRTKVDTSTPSHKDCKICRSMDSAKAEQELINLLFELSQRFELDIIRLPSSKRWRFGLGERADIRFFEKLSAECKRLGFTCRRVIGSTQSNAYEFDQVNHFAVKNNEIYRIRAKAHCEIGKPFLKDRGLDLEVLHDVEDAFQVPVGGHGPRIIPKQSANFLTVGNSNQNRLSEWPFPIDLVYTWVDSGDENWQASFNSHKNANTKVESTPSAVNAGRWYSRDELLYSIRSAEMYAPWIRNIFVVTDGQKPSWLVEDDRLKVVTHDEIYPDKSVLPTFNSNHIETVLQNIPGLSEHFLYLNDDFFFSKPVLQSDFFAENGIGYVFYSPRFLDDRPVSSNDRASVAAHKNSKSLLMQRFAVASFQKFKHAPYAMRKSVWERIEGDFTESLKQTRGNRFRTQHDLNGQFLYAHYALQTGNAVPSNLRTAYLDVSDVDFVHSMRKSLDSAVQFICVNDANSDAQNASQNDVLVKEYFENRFPIPTKWEK